MSGKGSKNRRQKRGKRSSYSLLINMPPRSYPGQLQSKQIVVGVQHRLVSAGASPYAATLQVTCQPPTDVSAWADFIASYQLYRCVKIKGDFFNFGSQTGMFYWWFSDNAITPTLGYAVQQQADPQNLGRVNFKSSISYLVTQLDMLAFVSTSANLVNPPSLNMYSDNNLNNTTASAQVLGILTVRYTLQFIGQN